MHRLAVALAPVLLASAFAGCTTLGAPLGQVGEPVARTTFRDGGSNATAWVLDVSGNFHIPTGTRFQVTAAETTCTTRGLQDGGNATYPCRTAAGQRALYDITVEDKAGDGRPTKGDRLHIVPGAAHDNGTLDRPHRLVLALHPELPLFALEQDFDPAGRVGDLRVEILG